jgi:hypothetical protein
MLVRKAQRGSGGEGDREDMRTKLRRYISVHYDQLLSMATTQFTYKEGGRGGGGTSKREACVHRLTHSVHIGYTAQYKVV